VGGEPKGTLEEWMTKPTSARGRGGTTGRDWLEGLDNTRVEERRVPGGGRLEAIEDAPGSYVLVRA
jgi:polyhydroxyalkanoate synthase